MFVPTACANLTKGAHPFRSASSRLATFGTQIASQLAHVPGLRLAAIAELDLTKARRAYGRGPDPRRPDRHSRRPCGH